MTRQHSWRREFAIPIVPLSSIQGEIHRLLDQVRPLGPSHTPADRPKPEPSGWSPAVDLVETPEALTLWADLPGVDPTSVDLSVTGQVLTLRGERPIATEGRGHSLERASGPFHRQVHLPCEVNVESIEAEARDGVLVVRLPKADVHRPRTIPVRTA
jgi:HSP20 family protein